MNTTNRIATLLANLTAAALSASAVAGAPWARLDVMARFNAEQVAKDGRLYAWAVRNLAAAHEANDDDRANVASYCMRERRFRAGQALARLERNARCAGVL